MTAQDRDPVPPQSAVMKALRLITCLAEAPDAMALRDLASQAGIAKPSAHRLLAELVEEEFVEAVGNGAYRPGVGLHMLAAAMEGHSGRGIPAVLDECAASVGHAVLLAVESAGAVTYTHKAEPELPYSMAVDVGARAPLIRSAAGLALLAWLPDDERAAALTDGDQLDPAAHAELEETRERGYAIEYGSIDDAVCSLAVPVFDRNERPVAAIVVTTLTCILTRARLARLAKQVTATAHEVANRL